MNLVRLALSLLAISALAACANFTPQDARPAHAVAEKQAPAVRPRPSPKPLEQQAPAPAGATESSAAPQAPPSTPPPAQDATTQNTVAKPALHLAAASIPPPPSNLWQRVRAGFGMPKLDSPLVRKNEQWYARHPDYVRRMMHRSARYLYYVVQEVEKRNMPTEIALLPMVESAYNPEAYSRSHAAGLWQFTVGTARHYGLKQYWWYDGRRDIRAATTAALNYLENLHNMFGNWDIALAAYNWGQGAVARAIARNRAQGKPTDFMSLRLPAETRNYVPRLLALKHIVMNPSAFGITLAPIPNRPYFTAVTTHCSMDVTQAALLAKVPLRVFVSLNPGYKQLILTRNHSASLLLPVDKAETFSTELEHCREPLLSWRSYTPNRREHLDRIARRFGISTSRLRKINGIPSRNRLVARGDTLLVPRRERFVGRAEGATRKLIHIVRPGDTLYVLALRHGVSVAQIRGWNRLKSNRLVPGQKLTLRVASTRIHRRVAMDKTRVAEGELVHVVRPGDTLYVLALRHGVSVAQIKSWNRLRSSRLVPGQKLFLRIASAGTHRARVATDRTRVAKGDLVHIVRPGDTLYVLALRHGVSVAQIKSWNRLRSSRLVPGQRLIFHVAASGKRGTQVAMRNHAGKRTLYTVRSGDTLHSIARRFNVAVNDIQRWNNLPDDHTLHPGETVAVYPQS